MPSRAEQRAISDFIQRYNISYAPKIQSCDSDARQEIPDAILRLEDGLRVGLEHTAPYPPKRYHERRFPNPEEDLSPLMRVLDSKFLKQYKSDSMDAVWLLVHLGITVPQETIINGTRGLQIPAWYDRVFLQWPIRVKKNDIRVGFYELPNQRLWYPGINIAA